MRVFKSAETVHVDCAKMHSAGDLGGKRYSQIVSSFMSSFGNNGRKRIRSATTLRRCSGERISGATAPRCGVNSENQIRLASGTLSQNLRKDSIAFSRASICPVTVQ